MTKKYEFEEEILIQLMTTSFSFGIHKGNPTFPLNLCKMMAIVEMREDEKEIKELIENVRIK